MRVVGYILIIIAVSLLTVNLYGLTQDLEPKNLNEQHLRFGEKDRLLDAQAFWLESIRKNKENDADYAERLTKAVAGRIAHVHWGRFPPDQFNQRVPVWENYLLYLAGLVSGIPEFERYHFASPAKAVERGVGLCGDASMLLSQLLDEAGISNQIVTIPGHVMVEATINDEKLLLDPDFGVVLNNSAMWYHKKPEQIVEYYYAAGYVDDGGVNIVLDGLKGDVQYWNGVAHFITKKYYFEKLSYIAIWALPVGLWLIGFFIVRRAK